MLLMVFLYLKKWLFIERSGNMFCSVVSLLVECDAAYITNEGDKFLENSITGLCVTCVTYKLY